MFKKNIDQLTLPDFQDHPVWMYTESIEDEDEVTPYLGQMQLDGRNMIYFIASEFRLADESKYHGYLRYAYSNVTFIALAVEERLAEFSLVAEIQQSLGETQETFADSLGKTMEQVFPMYYDTGIQLASGIFLQGELR